MSHSGALFGARLTEFNLLPSRTLHPTRHAEFEAPQPAAGPLPVSLEAAWHRQWSRQILRRLGLHDQPVRDAQRPELALALLPPEPLARCAQWLGVALCGPRLRRAIAGADVRRLLDGLGADAMAFARQSATTLHPGIAGCVSFSADDTVAAVARLGRATLMEALRGGGPELARRAELKLPAGPTGDAPLPARESLALALDVLKITEPTWHSSFPAIH